MNRLLSDDLWVEVQKLADQSERKVAAVSYVTTDSFVKFGKGDMLVIDASDKAITSGVTSAPVLNRAFERGVEIYSCPGLHAKVMVFDQIAIIGSANLSLHSPQCLIEAALMTDYLPTVAMAEVFVRKLAAQSTRVDPNFLNRIKSLEVLPRENGIVSEKSENVSSKVGQSETWLVGLAEFSDDEFPEEMDAMAKGQTIADSLKTKKSSVVRVIRFSGWNKGFRKEAKEGDLVIQIWRPLSEKEPRFVFKPCQIVHRQEEAKSTLFYIEMLADWEKTAMAWDGFFRLAEQIGVPRKISSRTVRRLQPRYANAILSLWGTREPASPPRRRGE